MPERFINTARHNEKLTCSLIDVFPNDFYDWKITGVFYCAYHLLQASAKKRGISIGSRHHDIESNINPRFPNRSFQISKNAYHWYSTILNYSISARYDGFIDYDLFIQLKQRDFNFATDKYLAFRNYVNKTLNIPSEDFHFRVESLVI